MTRESRTKRPEFGSFREWLTTNRNRARYSVRELARDAGVSHTFIGNLEDEESPVEDRIKRVDREYIELIAKVLGISPDEGLYHAGWLRELPDDPPRRPEIERVPFADELYEAGWDESLPESVRQEMLAYLRFKRSQASGAPQE